MEGSCEFCPGGGGGCIVCAGLPAPGPTDPAAAVLVAADSVGKLRRGDVFRVLEWSPVEDRGIVAAYLSAERPDLAGEVAECVRDLGRAG